MAKGNLLQLSLLIVLVIAMMLTFVLGQRHWNHAITSYSNYPNFITTQPNVNLESTTPTSKSVATPSLKPEAVQAVIAQNSKQWNEATDDQKKVYEYINKILRDNFGQK